MKNKGLFLIFSLVSIILLSISIHAQDSALGDESVSDTDIEAQSEDSDSQASADILADAEQEFSGAELEQGAGITPDSGFYFIEDKILTNFRNDVENKEKKIAEISAMVQEGNIDAAREALHRYNKYASNLEEEIDPDSSQNARRSAVAIKRTLRGIESQIPEDQRSEFVDQVLEQESSIITAAEIAGKIKKLCEELSALDPGTYASTCKTGKDSPKWQQRLDRDLTEEQEKEAREFFEVMSSCFENPRECECEKIKIQSFAEECKIIAPLAASCELDGNEEACDEMDERGDPIDLLPDYLQEVMRDIEGEYNEAEFDNHAPRECREAGVTDMEGCMEVMFRSGAPEECIEALDSGKLDLSNEREARKQCEEIMFEANAPLECIDAGIRDHKECGRFMFKESAPQECTDAGLDGSSPSHPKKCRQLMESFGREGSGPEGGRERGPRINFDCKRIQNSEERLACFDNAVNGAQEHFDNRGPPGGWPKPCEEAGATNRGSCEQIMRQWGEQQRNRDPNEREFREEFDNRGPGSFGSGPGNFRGPPCSTPEECEKFARENPDFRPPEGEFREGDFREGEFREGFREGEFREFPREQFSPSGEPGQGFSPPESSSSGTLSPESSGSSGSSSGSSGSGESGSITGGVISNNRFMRYYFRY